MSGEDGIAHSPRSAQPIEERLRVDGHRNLLRALATGEILGAAFLAYALTMDFPIPPMPQPDPVVERPIIILPPTSYTGPLTKRVAPKVRQPQMAGMKAPPPAVQNPGKEVGRLAVKVIGSLSPRADYLASELVDKFLSQVDQDKVDNTSLLTRGGTTRFAATRMGVKRDEFNPRYDFSGDPDSDGNGLIGTISGDGGRIKAQPKGPERIGGSFEIEMVQDGKVRSSESILATVRAHASGLRHIYNGFLKLRPGFSGKVTVRFAISPRGDVVDAALAGSTTHVSEFDEKILQAVSAWRFEPVRLPGNDIVTVPFTFSE